VSTRAPLTFAPLDRGRFDGVVECASHYPGFGAATRVFLEHIANGWGRDQSVFGVVLLDGEQVAGFATALFMRRFIRREESPFCCLGPWYVLPAHRAHSLALMAAVLRDRTCTYVTMSPNASSVKVLGRFRFEPLAADFIVVPPLAQARTLMRLGAAITSRAEEVLARVDAVDRRYVEDHRVYGCNAFLLGRDGDYGLVITKRRTLRNRPVSEILYVRNAGRVLASFERVKLAILRADQCVAVMSDPRILQGRRLLGIRKARTRLFRSPQFQAADIDNLYSEIVVR
jgi:hypothetical protein